MTKLYIQYVRGVSGTWYASVDTLLSYLSACADSQKEATKSLLAEFPNEIARLEKCLGYEISNKKIEKYQETIKDFKQALHEYSLGANAL